LATRKEEQARRREERLAAERREQEEARRRRLTAYVAGGVLAVAILVVVVVVVASSGGGSSSSSSTPTLHKNSVPPAAEVGTVTTPPPWNPVYKDLGQRIDAMGLPGLSDTAFHIHALLHVYVNGKEVTVPADIGLDQAAQVFSPIHTHDESGIVHMEATKTYPFTIGQFFAVWGVRFSNSQLGPYKSNGQDQLRVYVTPEGGSPQLVQDPVDYVMQEHDDISVGYGKPGSFPEQPPASFPAGL
jgi:hypothetical protein